MKYTQEQFIEASKVVPEHTAELSTKYARATGKLQGWCQCLLEYDAIWSKDNNKEYIRARTKEVLAEVEQLLKGE